MRPNILWLVMDTVRADALEPYGAPVGASPVVADLARRGVVAPHLRSTACWTLPAHVSMFAGQLPRAAGFHDQAGLHPDNAKPAVEALADRMLASVLRRAGYATGAVSANLWVSERSGFAPGFDRFADAVTTRQGRMSSLALRDRAAWLWEAARGTVDDGAQSAGQVLQGWAHEVTDEPFFWFVNLVEGHSPYLPPRPYGGASRLTRARAGREAAEFLTQGGVWRACVKREMPSAGALARMRELYGGAVRYMDDWLERVLSALDAAGKLDDTLIMVTADHGENFGENDLLAHGFSLDDRLVRVPGIFAGPGAERLADVRSLAELPARLAEIAGIAEHPYQEDDLPALAVAQFDPPVRPPEDKRTAHMIDVWDLDDAAVELLVTPITMAADGDVKLVVSGDREGFYRPGADPLETQPLTDSDLDPAVVARLRAALRHPAATASATTWKPASPDAPAAAPQDLADLEDRMRLLGYL
jgi:arylsulfatase A-like enzyme